MGAQLGPKATQSTGKFSVGTFKELDNFGAKAVDLKNPGLELAAASGRLVGKGNTAKREADHMAVGIGILKQPKKDLNVCPDHVFDPGFQKKDVALVQRRVPWNTHQPDKPDYKRDIIVGTQKHCKLA